MNAETKKEIRTFFIICISLWILTTYLKYRAYVAPGSASIIVVFAHMWGPGIAAIATRLIHRGNLRGMGWEPGKLRFLLTAYCVPLALAFVAYGAVWLSGLGGVRVSRLVFEIINDAPFVRDFPVVVMLAMLAIYGMLRNLLTATGEEIGWTGFLTPTFLEITTPAKSSLAVGLIWAIWHYPLILFAGYNAGTSLWLAIPFFTIMLVGFSFVRTWLWMGSGSLWTGAILHAAHNLFIQVFFDIITVDLGGTKLYTTEFGCGMALVYAAVAVPAFLSFRKRALHSTSN